MDKQDTTLCRMCVVAQDCAEIPYSDGCDKRRGNFISRAFVNIDSIEPSAMTKQEAVEWLKKLNYDIRSMQTSELWGYGKRLEAIIELLESEANEVVCQNIRSEAGENEANS